MPSPSPDSPAPPPPPRRSSTGRPSAASATRASADRRSWRRRRSSPTSSGRASPARRSTRRPPTGRGNSSRPGAWPNAHLESWPFGRGWSFERCTAHVVSPMSFPLVALPKAWTAGTNGPVRGKVLRVTAESEADVEGLKGKIAGMILWVGQPRELKGPEQGGVFKRYTDAQLDEIEQYQIPGAPGRPRPEGAVRPRGVPEAAPGAAGPRQALRGGEAAGRGRAVGARRQRPAARQRRLAQEGGPRKP